MEKSDKNGIAAVLSFILPGLGQIFKGKIGKGLCFLFFSAIGYCLLIVPGVVLHIFSIIDAYSAE